MVMTKKSRMGQLGQSIVEIAIATPVLVALLLGAFDTAVLVSDKVIAGGACRQGARLAAELGGTVTNNSVPPMSWGEADLYIARNVLAVAKAMNYSVLTDIYIYSPAEVDGNLPVNGTGTPVSADRYDWFKVTGVPGSYTLAAPTFGNLGLDLDHRLQIPPSETPIGVKLRWKYQPPTGLGLNVALTEYAVFLAAPVIP
jgi:Flp pilus assembly protein TadG